MKYICLLRAINVGGHNVSMAELRKNFESLGFSSVETFIASGNVIFETKVADGVKLEARIQKSLHQSLGYVVDAFLRTPEELSAVAEQKLFPDDELASAAALNVGFTSVPLNADQRKRLSSFETEIDRFATSGREMFWLCRVKQSESRFASAAVERALQLRVTWRGMNTVRRLVSKYPPSVKPNPTSRES